MGLGCRRGAAVRPGRGAGGLALCEVERALLPAIGQLLCYVAPLPAEWSSASWSRSPTSMGRSPWTRITAGDALCRYVWLVDRVGDGPPLTAAGWLPAAVVTETMDALWPQDGGSASATART